MKKYFEATPNLDGLKEKIIVLKDGEDRKTLIAVIAPLLLPFMICFFN